MRGFYLPLGKAFQWEHASPWDLNPLKYRFIQHRFPSGETCSLSKLLITAWLQFMPAVTKGAGDQRTFVRVPGESSSTVSLGRITFTTGDQPFLSKHLRFVSQLSCLFLPQNIAFIPSFQSCHIRIFFFFFKLKNFSSLYYTDTACAERSNGSLATEPYYLTWTPQDVLLSYLFSTILPGLSTKETL